MIGEEEENKKVLVGFAVWLGITILVAAYWTYSFEGIPLGFTIPNHKHPRHRILNTLLRCGSTVAIYIGVVGLKELVVERRFSVEFLMAVAGLGALAWITVLKQPQCYSSIA